MRATPLRALVGLCLVSLLAACSSTPSLEASTDFDPRFDFRGVKKIAIQPVDRLGVAAISISDMQISRVNAALASELQRKGFILVEDNSEADMLLAWHLVTEERMDVRNYNSMSYYNCWRCGPVVSDVSVRQYTMGTLIVDMIDPLRNQSVWRAIVDSRLRSSPTPEQTAELNREAARALFAEFPPTGVPTS